MSEPADAAIETATIPETRVNLQNHETEVAAELARQGRTAEVEPETNDDPEPEDEGGKSNREAARYRTRLRETEAQRDALTARVEGYQRADVLRQAGDRLADPGDVFDVGRVNLADLLDENGQVVAELVDTAVMGLLESRPGLGKAAKPRGPSSAGAGNRSSTAGTGTSWGKVLRG